MNRLLLNSGSLNGAIRGLVLATAVVACSSSVGATAVRVAVGQGNLSGQAICTSSATYVHSTPAVNVLGQGLVFANPAHVQAGSANLLGSSDVTAYVLRAIPAAVTFYGAAEIVCVVASTQAQALLTGSASVISEAARTQAAYVLGTSTSSVSWVVEPTVWRMPQASVAGEASIRVEPTVNGLSLAYVDVRASAQIIANALCTRLASGLITGQANGIATGTLQQSGYVLATGSSSLIIAEPTIKATLLSNLTGTAEVNVLPVLGKVAVSNLAGTALITVTALQKHSVLAQVTGQAALQVVPQVTSYLNALVTGQVDIQAQATRYLIASSQVEANASVQSTGNAAVLAFVNCLATSDMVVSAEALNARRVSANAQCIGGAEVLPYANASVLAYCNASGAASLTGSADDINSHRVLATTVGVASCEITAKPNVTYTAQVQVNCHSLMDIEPEVLNLRRVSANSVVAGTADMHTEVNINHAGKTTIQSEAVVIGFSEDLNTRSVLAFSNADAQAEVTGTPVRVVNPLVTLSGTAGFTALGDTVVRQVYAQCAVHADMVADAVVDRHITAQLECGAAIEANAQRTLLITRKVLPYTYWFNGFTLNGVPVGYADSYAHLPVMLGTAEIFADTIANPESIDPEYRTYLRPADITAFVRPVEETIFKRTA